MLWSPCPPEEAATGLFVQAAFAALANASASKDKDLRCAAVRTLIRCVKSFGQRVNVVTAALGLLISTNIRAALWQSWSRQHGRLRSCR
jgi:hypothetical protein